MPAEPATTSTPASEPNAASRPKDGVPLLLSVPAAAPAAVSQAVQLTVTPFHSAIPSQLTHGTPAVTNQPFSQHAAPLITTKKRSAKEISAEKGDFGHAPMLGPLKKRRRYSPKELN
ncbi:hypothetical protein THAOC_10432 [Thalassiosira oceanica]|uniref:Uncharacterized protein n=1 Tax=Thalassiosira oceanica TaxID=159749 RepID=K0TD11_THAOC|nr:hypothetical protein THAOC_10432 [Thalassiosira oceanica]|eukprot:EJK68392.1 hypothetical protein THAOC_10432 [Thalassiosira oceanica]